MNPRVSGSTRSVFYRGISLKEYLKKTSATQPNLEYRDDDTILVDENQVPVLIDDDFILTEAPQVSSDVYRLKNNSCLMEFSRTPRKSFYLPQVASGKQIKTKMKNPHTERNSTDTSLGSQLEMRIGFLPSLDKKQVIRERNITMASRGSSNQTSCRKKVTEMKRVVEEPQQGTLFAERKQSGKNQYVEMRKEKLKQRYNLNNLQQNSIKWRVKSYAQ